MGQTASHLNGLGPQLIKAAKAGDADAVTELVSSKPELLRYCTFRHMGPCHYAAKHDHVEVLQQLVAKAQEVEQLRWQEAAASSAKLHAQLFGASAEADQHQHRLHATQAGLVQQLVSATTDRGVTPLMLAADSGSIASVKLLLEKGADPWAVDKLGGRTALHYACRQDSLEIVQMLVEAAGSGGPVHFPNRANTSYVDVRTQTGFSAMHFAVATNSQQCLAVLLNLGANPLLSSLFDSLDTINCSRGTTALHLAARQGNEAIAKQLLRAYVETWSHRNLPDPRLVLDGDNFLPCQVAARRQHEDVARMLLPSNPIASMFGPGDLNLVGPPTLAAIAGVVLRATLSEDLGQLLARAQEARKQRMRGGSSEASVASTDAASTVDVSEAAPRSSDDFEEECSATTEEGCCSEEQEHEGAVTCDAAGDVGEVDSSPPASSVGDDALCGVCFDAPLQVVLSPCGHQLCASCCKSLLELNSRCVMQCPFCRGGVGHLAPICQPADVRCGGMHHMPAAGFTHSTPLVV